jgi:hypothetical protein
MKPLPPIPASFQKKLTQMWKSACRVCDNILAYQPDLVLSLMHSGWGPVFTAQILWQQTQLRPFPPVARPNLGREKTDDFDQAVNFFSSGMFMGIYAVDIDTGHFLSWLTTRTDWQAQLRQLVAEAMPGAAAPQRILVVDDCIHEGSTYILTLGLLELVYPQAEVRFLNADGWYSSDYRDLMLDSVCPVAEVFPEGKLPGGKVLDALGKIAVGSENTAPDSLFWQPISPDSPAVQVLTAFHPAEEWVEMSRAVYAMLAHHILERAASYTPAQPDENYINFQLNPAWRLMRAIWLQNGITRRQAEQYVGLSPQAVKHILGGWIGTDQVMLVGRGRTARYVIPPPIMGYLSSRPGEFPSDPLDLLWLLPGRLAFGEDQMNFHGKELSAYSREQINHLLDLGVDCWIDVQTTWEGGMVGENRAFGEESQRRGRAVVMHPIVLETMFIDGQNRFQTKRGRPDRRDIRPILDQIDRYLAEGRVVFVSSDSRDLRGILAGCYLARHGQAGPAALKALQACRAKTVRSWRRDPVSDKAQRYVRTWPAGL